MSTIGSELRWLRREVARLNRKLAMQRLPGKVKERGGPDGRQVRLDLGEDPATGKAVLSGWVRVQSLSAGAFKGFVLPSIGEQMYLESPSGVIGADSVATFGTFDDDNKHPVQDQDELVIENGKTRVAVKGDHVHVVSDEHSMTLTPNGLTVDADSKFAMPVEFRKGIRLTGTGGGRGATIEGDIRVAGNIYATENIVAQGAIHEHGGVPTS
ncbi:MAG: phage baseplate assembly protein V [Parvibaculum sp.]|uniref:phage baseplate assembly protein V n=1 Tax=Chelatococcus sp. TaxID=1953771 RepID=UPI001ECC18B6|nr:phage baseplate assembly protein V [Chelatococcus sp.]MBX3506842.1 phage baseplate assembly protein V [Parvibaculum sp.]MBX3545589.1 phage baseplate assembly protein V [Chelatococcus sp.]